MGTTVEYPATIVLDSTCTHIFKEREMCMNKLNQVAGYSAAKPKNDLIYNILKGIEAVGKLKPCLF